MEQQQDKPTTAYGRLQRELAEQVAQKTVRRQRAARRRGQSLWFGLGMFGLVGWSVAIPTLLGVAVGVWLDTRYTSGYSWTLMLLIIGLLLGSLNAWYWVSRARKEIVDLREED